MKITLEESTTEKISPLLEEFMKGILSQNENYDSLQKDCFFLLIIVSMIENGFLLVNNELQVIHNLGNMSKWRSSTGEYESTFVLSGFKNIYLKLITSPLGSMALVNLVIKELNVETYSVCLPVSRYVVSPQATTIPMIFRDLKQFSTVFKNKIISAAKSRILEYHGYPSASLIGLPEEVLLKVMLYLPAVDIVNMCKTCTRLNVLLQTADLWHDMYKRDFQYMAELKQGDWKELYKEMFILQNEKNLRTMPRTAGTMHDYMDYSDYVSYVDNPVWNVYCFY